MFFDVTVYSYMFLTHLQAVLWNIISKFLVFVYDIYDTHTHYTTTACAERLYRAQLKP